MRYSLAFFLAFFIHTCIAQHVLKIEGYVKSERAEPLHQVNVKVAGQETSVRTDKKGFYSISAIGGSSITLEYRLTGFLTQRVEISRGERAVVVQNVFLKADNYLLNQVEVKGNAKPGNMSRIGRDLISNIPAVSGNFESVLKTLPGVSANNELSAQFSVRGGNFDENLIYINDVEIYRPLLVRNGQQEGLSFINPELLSRASFSAGGFEARYGDKLSSVLDVRYERPDSQQIILSAGLLGTSATAKLRSKNNFTLIGLRNKTNQSILRSQPVNGIYQPRFYDFQFYHNLSAGKKVDVSFFGDYNLSHFQLVPQSRETTFGTISEQYRLRVDYEGQEKDRYEALTGALTLAYKPSSQLLFKWISSVFSIQERESFDIEGSYIFDQPATEEEGAFGNVRSYRGIGVDYGHARNTLDATIYSSELRAYLSKGRFYWEAGTRLQFDRIDDKLNEYYLTDSAGYTLPYTPGPLLLTDVVNAANFIETRRITAFIQNTFNISDKLTLSAGLRSNFNSFTDEFILSPRLGVLYKKEGSDLLWRFSAGSYVQPPFYRELRDFNGNIFQESKAQRSLHFLIGNDRSFNGLGTRLKFSSELYYKKLSNLIPYKVENLRIRYFAGQQAKGYAAGADFSVSGAFVEGLESSFRVSLMKTEEDIEGDFYDKKDAGGNSVRVEPGYLKRPTDQRINVSAFFQDRLFNSPTYKVHLTLLYGSSLPVGPPQTERYQDIYKIPSYRRVDIGFSKDFIQGGSGRKLRFLKKGFDSFIAYAEVFNLLNINNTVSYLWIKDVNNNQFAIPNFLTSRQLNFKIIAKIKNR